MPDIDPNINFMANFNPNMNPVREDVLRSLMPGMSLNAIENVLENDSTLRRWANDILEGNPENANVLDRNEINNYSRAQLFRYKRLARLGITNPGYFHLYGYQEPDLLDAEVHPDTLNSNQLLEMEKHAKRIGSAFKGPALRRDISGCSPLLLNNVSGLTS